jgi:hypothetical protein
VSSQSATTQLQLQLAQQMLAFATQQATLLQQALPFMLPVCPSKVAEKLNQVLNSLHAKPIVEKLVAAGLSELQAQKACLEYSSRYRNNKLTSDAVLQWVKQHGDMSELSRCEKVPSSISSMCGLHSIYGHSYACSCLRVLMYGCLNCTQEPVSKHFWNFNKLAER